LNASATTSQQCFANSAPIAAPMARELSRHPHDLAVDAHELSGAAPAATFSVLTKLYDQPSNAYLFAKKVIERVRGAPIRLNRAYGAVRADRAVGAAPEQS
jgi:hypothetical protein